MATAKKGNTVKLNYTGKLNDGKVFDSSLEREPFEFTLGTDQVIPGFEKAITGMKVGESKTVEIPCKEAYGPAHEAMIFEVDKEKLPADMKFEVGQVLQVPTKDGSPMMTKVVAVTDDKVKMDANHPLADQDLTFELSLLEIN
jgi:peptidylprolyl isomerase